MRRTSGTVTIFDLLRRPTQLVQQLRVVLGGSPATSVVDQAETELGFALSTGAFVRSGSSWRQVLLCFDRLGPLLMYWRPYRALRGYGKPVAFPLPARVVEGGPVTGPGSWKIKKPLFALLGVTTASAFFEVAVPRADVPTFLRAVDLATAEWRLRNNVEPS